MCESTRNADRGKFQRHSDVLAAFVELAELNLRLRFQVQDAHEEGTESSWARILCANEL